MVDLSKFTEFCTAVLWKKKETLNLIALLFLSRFAFPYEESNYLKWNIRDPSRQTSLLNSFIQPNWWSFIKLVKSFSESQSLLIKKSTAHSSKLFDLIRWREIPGQSCWIQLTPDICTCGQTVHSEQWTVFRTNESGKINEMSSSCRIECCSWCTQFRVSSPYICSVSQSQNRLTVLHVTNLWMRTPSLLTSCPQKGNASRFRKAFGSKIESTLHCWPWWPTRYGILPMRVSRMFLRLTTSWAGSGRLYECHSCWAPKSLRKN